MHLRAQADKLCRRYVGCLRFEFAQCAKVGGRIERVRGFEIRSVQPSVRDRAELADEVFALDVTDDAVCISVTETQVVAERRQEAIVVENSSMAQQTAVGFERTAFARKFSTIAKLALMIDECL